MPPKKPVKATSAAYRTVAVVTTTGELRKAGRLAQPPDLFELRLDCLFPAKNLEPKIARLGVPLIITARHPAEGGKNNLSARARRDLLVRFLPWATYVDIELRSVGPLRTWLRQIRRRKVGLILSVHDFKSTPTLGSLRARAWRAKALGAAIFKVATRTETVAEVGRLLELVAVTRTRIPTCALGIGRLGAVSRLLLAQCGSALVYTSLGQPRIEGQLSLKNFRAAIRQAGFI